MLILTGLIVNRYLLFARKKTQRNFLELILWTALLLVCRTSVIAFNIDNSETSGTARLIRPYIARPNEEVRNPVFFGYNFLIKKGTTSTPR